MIKSSDVEIVHFKWYFISVPNDEEDIINNSETFPDLSSEEITKNALFTASWGEDYISDDDKNYFPSEDSDSDEFI